MRERAADSFFATFFPTGSADACAGSDRMAVVILLEVTQ